ncbi:MAG TPA: PQQ-binding-like beta-propeller repeat protein [Vicinamibacterales bacterium]
MNAAPAPSPPFLFPIRPLWTLALNSQITVAPAFDGSIGYFSIDGGRVVAYDLVPGTQKWIIDAQPDIEPAAGGGFLFTVESGLLTARRSVDGSIEWQVPLSAELAVPAVWDNGWLITVTKNREISALRSADGTTVWRRTIGGDAHARPALAADRVYVPTDDGHVVALRVDDGTPVWDRTISAAANDILALDERLYVGSNDNNLYCILTKDGSIDWMWPTGGDVIGRPVFDERNVYFVSLDNILRALDLKSGAQRWKTMLPIRPTRGPLRASDALIVAGIAPKVVAYNTKDGKPAGDVPSTGDLAAAPQLVEIDPAAKPILILVTSDIAKGAGVAALTRATDPPVVPIAPLPNITLVMVPKS